MSNNRTKQLKRKRALLASSALFKRKKYVAIIAAALCIIIFLNLASPYKLIFIEDVRTNNVLWKSDIKTDEWFHHQYIHSVEKTIVIEKFRVDHTGEILTMESWTRSFGAGLPFEQQGTVEIKDGYYILRDLNRPIHGGVLLMKPSTLYPHSFHFRELELSLSEPPYAGTVIKIDVKQANWLQAFLYLLTRD